MDKVIPGQLPAIALSLSIDKLTKLITVMKSTRLLILFTGVVVTLFIVASCKKSEVKNMPIASLTVVNAVVGGLL